MFKEEKCKTFSNSLTYWYPRIKDLVPTPKTTIIELKEGVVKDMMEEKFPIDDLVKAVETVVWNEGYYYPIFVRTDQMSVKHSWPKTCFIEDSSKLQKNLLFLLEENVLIADMQPDLIPRAIVIREFLKLKTFFTTIRGMPVAREFRFFATHGKVDCHHPYWPHGALEEEMTIDEEMYKLLKRAPPVVNKEWRNLIPALEDDTNLPYGMVYKASSPFTDQVSVDICQTTDGRWYVTDMACGVNSFHWPHNDPTGGSRGDEEET